MSDQYQNENRKFLHDIATPISILRLIMRRVIAINDGTAPAEDMDRTREFLSRAMLTLETIENLHADFKSVLNSRESDETLEHSPKRSE